MSSCPLCQRNSRSFRQWPCWLTISSTRGRRASAVQLRLHLELLRHVGQHAVQRGRVGELRRRLEVHAHEEAAGGAGADQVAELLRIDDVAAGLEQQAGDGVHDALGVAARQPEDEFALAGRGRPASAVIVRRPTILLSGTRVAKPAPWPPGLSRRRQRQEDRRCSAVPPVPGPRRQRLLARPARRLHGACRRSARQRRGRRHRGRPHRRAARPAVGRGAEARAGQAAGRGPGHRHLRAPPRLRAGDRRLAAVGRQQGDAAAGRPVHLPGAVRARWPAPRTPSTWRATSSRTTRSASASPPS